MPSGPGGSGEAGATWALLVAAGEGARLGIDRPKAFAQLAGRPLLAESLERLDHCPWVDAIVVAAPARVGGAGDPALRGDRRVEGRRVRHGRCDARRVGAARRWPRCRRRRSWCSSTTPRGRSWTMRWSSACWSRSGRGSTARFPLFRSRTRSSVSRAASSRRPSGGRSSSVRRRRRRFSHRRFGVPSQETSPAQRTARRSVERAGGRVAVVEGDPRLVKVTTAADLELVATLLDRDDSG